MRRGFSLIELLVVIAIIGILAASMIPAYGKIFGASEEATCRNNLMNLGRAISMYGEDRSGGESSVRLPSAGIIFTGFMETVSEDPHKEEQRYGQSRGWIYVDHSCARASGDTKSNVGNGNYRTLGYGDAENEEDYFVNDLDNCRCFNVKSDEGGIGAKVSSWYGPDAELCIKNGDLYTYCQRNEAVFICKAHVKLASKTEDISGREIKRSYAMNVLAGADERLYDTGSDKYNSGYYQTGARATGRALLNLSPHGDSRNALPAKVALLVELDGSKKIRNGSKDGDGVWDWDNLDEKIGFNHDQGDGFSTHILFGDGHVERVLDPGTDDKRLKLSKWYGSGGLDDSGELF